MSDPSLSDTNVDVGRAGPDRDAAVDDLDPATLRAHVELLREDNERLRNEYRRAKRTTYRRTALGLIAVGALAGGAAAAFPTVRTVLVVLAGIGLFGGILTYYLTPERVLSTSIPESVVRTHAATIRALVTELGLQEDRLYVPVDQPTPTAKLYRPLHPDYVIPDTEQLTRLFVGTDNEDERGIALQPTGSDLYREFEAAATTPLDPATVVETLADGLIEQFELATAATVDRSTGRATVEVNEVTIDGIDQPDHPIPSFLATGTAITLETPVRVAAIRVDDTDATLTLTWDAGARPTTQ